MYGMRRTTVYLPEDLKSDLTRVAREKGTSEAELIRKGVRYVVKLEATPKPTIPLFTSSDPTMAERVDELLVGFGDS